MKAYKTVLKDDSNIEHELIIKYITDESELPVLETLLKTTGGEVVGLDIETGKAPTGLETKDGPTPGLDPYLSRIRLLQFYFGNTDVYVIDAFRIPRQRIKKLFTGNSAVTFSAHYGQFERKHLLHTFGIEPKVECTMVMAQSIARAQQPNFAVAGFGIAAVSKRFLGLDVDKFYQDSDWDRPELLPEQIVYAGIDAYLVHRLHPLLLDKIHQLGVEKSWKAIRACAPAIAEMEYTGVAVDWARHSALVSEWKGKQQALQSTMDNYFPGVNVNSGPQMARWLESKASSAVLNSWPKTEKGAYSFSADALDNFKHSPAIAALTNYKDFNKRLSTYGESLAAMKHPVTQRLHTSYTENTTSTSRLSSREPNQQNYPRDPEFRSLFIPGEGMVFVIADYSQIELRIQGEVSRDPTMLEIFSSGKDSYSQIAALIYHKTYDEIIALGKKSKERQFAKNTALGLSYGMGWMKLMHYIKVNTGIDISETEAQVLWTSYHNRIFPVYSNWCTKQRGYVERNGRLVSTVLGCKRKLTEDEVFTCAVNQVIQGTGAEVMRVGTVYVKAMKDAMLPEARLVASIHDELIMEVPENKAEQGRTILQAGMLKGWTHIFPDGVTNGVVEATICTDWSLKS